MPTQLHENLARFAEKRDETCFAQVVEEFSGMVFNGALRRTGDRQLAEEVTQNVFAIAARKARSLSRHPQLTAWFHTTTRFEAGKAMQSRHRYRSSPSRRNSFRNPAI
jgi:DNA-directed RNA polymerase specialized sigma24 family protein